MPNDLLGRFDHALAASGFGIDEVRVSGQRFTADNDIFDCLDLPNVKTLKELDSARAAARIERLPWVRTATITRVYPGRLDVVVTEREPFAVWLTDGGARLIDATGRTLSAVPMSRLPDLPRFAGDGAPEAAGVLLEVLAGVPQVGQRLKLATRVTGRRWSLELTEGLRIELPPEGEAGALADLVSDLQGQALLAASDSVIDLRSRREIAVRRLGAP